MALEDVANPISTAELERRWAMVRAAMDARGIDALVMQNSNDFHGGYVKWFTDHPATYGVYQSVIFPRDDRMIAVRHGPWRKTTVPPDDPVNRGVGRLITAPTFAAADFTRHYHADLVAEELKTRGCRTIGVVGTGSMSYAFLDHLKSSGLLNAAFVDATEWVDEIKAVKSAEEIDFIRRTAAMQDAAMDEVLKAVRPGLKNADLTALARYVGEKMGSEQGLFMAGSGAVGKSAQFLPRHMQQRELRDGDQFTVLIENNGPGGFYTEIGRTCVMGKASQDMKDEFAFVLEAQRYTLDMIRPGADPQEIIARYNDYMRKNGRPEEDRLHSHGQGYDLVERPLVAPGETIKLAANMNIVVHPTYATKATFSWVCDNYLIGENGISESLHKTPQKIFEL